MPFVVGPWGSWSADLDPVLRLVIAGRTVASAPWLADPSIAFGMSMGLAGVTSMTPRTGDRPRR